VNAVTAPRSSSAVRAGRLVGLLAATAFLLAALTGNSLSLHVGMTPMTPAAATGAEIDHKPAPAVAAPSAAPEIVGDASGDPGTPLAINSKVHHLMHLVGACMAVVAAAALLMSLLFRSRVAGGGYAACIAVPRLVAPTALGALCPPALSPPTSSPVIRT
jgi:hypothetical protein